MGKLAERVIADRGYDADSLVELIEQQGSQVVIPPHKNRKQPRVYGRDTYKERHLIECLFSKIKYYQRVFSRFDKLARNDWSFLCFVCALLWLR